MTGPPGHNMRSSQCQFLRKVRSATPRCGASDAQPSPPPSRPDTPPYCGTAKLSIPQWRDEPSGAAPCGSGDPLSPGARAEHLHGVHFCSVGPDIDSGMTLHSRASREKAEKRGALCKPLWYPVCGMLYVVRRSRENHAKYCHDAGDLPPQESLLFASAHHFE